MSLFETLYLTLNVDSAEFDRAIKTSARNVDELTVSLSKANRAAGNLGSSLKETANKTDKLASSLDNADKNTEKLGSSLEDINKATEELAPNVDKVGQVTKELNSALQGAKETADKLASSTNKTDSSTQKLGARFGAAYKEAYKFYTELFSLDRIMNLVLNSAADTSALGRQAAQMGVNVSTLDTWRKAVQESGGDADAFSNTMGKLAKKVKDPEAALFSYSKKLEGMNRIQAHKTGKALGLDEGTIELLRQGTDSVDALLKKQRQLGVITKEQVKQSDQFNKQLNGLKVGFGSAATQLGIALMPVFEAVLKQFTRLSAWMLKHKQTTVTFFTVLAGVATAVFVPAMLQAAMATLAATWPLLLIGAAIAALALIVDDLIAYFNGWDSATGELVKKFPLLGTILDGLKSGVLLLKDAFSGLATLFNFIAGVITNPTKALSDLKNLIKETLDDIFGSGTGDTVFKAIEDALNAMLAPLNYVKKLINDLFKSIGNLPGVSSFLGSSNTSDPQALQNAQQSMFDLNKAVYDFAQNRDLTQGGKEYINGISGSAVTTMNSSTIANSNSNSNVSKNTSINIGPIQALSDNPRELGTMLVSQLSSFMAQHNDGKLA